MALTTEQIQAFDASLKSAKEARKVKLEDYHKEQDALTEAREEEARAVSDRIHAEGLTELAYLKYEDADAAHDKVLADFIELLKADAADNTDGAGA